MQKRYINLNCDATHDLVKMCEIDNLVYEQLSEFIKININLKNHTNHTIDKFKNIMNDLNASNKINKELKTIVIKYFDQDGNEKNQPSYDSNNINYLITTNSNSWTEASKYISDTYDINYNDELKYIISTFNDYYKEKCPQRDTKVLNDCSTLVIDYKLNKITYKINATLMQINILMLFQNKPKLKLQSINEQIAKKPTELTMQHIKNVCDSLVVAKLLVMEDEEMYCLDDNMKMPKI